MYYFFSFIQNQK